MLNDKDRELISIGASLAAGCQPCARFHLRAAHIAGASDTEIRQAVDEALAVRRHATEEMAQLAAKDSGVPTSDTPGDRDDLLTRELVAISAACAVNSIPDFETHLAAAQSLGATKGQLLSAIKIASAVKSTAERKLEEATGRALGGKPVETESCCQSVEDGANERATKRGTPAQERSGAGKCGPTCGCYSENQKKDI